MDTNTVLAITAVLNVIVLLWLTRITRHYAKATHDALEIMRTSSYGTAYAWASDLLSNQEAVDNRRKLFDADMSKYPKYKDLPGDLRAAFEDCCRRYDCVAILGQNRMLPHLIIAREWGYSIIRSYEICKPFIRHYQEERGTMFWNNFEQLYRVAKEEWS